MRNSESSAVPPTHASHARAFAVVFGLLLALLGLTVGVAWLSSRRPMGAAGPMLSYGIAGLKAALILVYFMHVRWGSRLVWIFSTAAFVWLGVLFVLMMTDYTGRGDSAARRAESRSHLVTAKPGDPGVVRP